MIARVRVLTSHISHDPVLAGDVAVYFMRVFQQVCALKRLVGIHAAFDIAQGVVVPAAEELCTERSVQRRLERNEARACM